MGRTPLDTGGTQARRQPRRASPATRTDPDNAIVATGTAEWETWVRDHWDRVSIDGLRLCRLTDGDAPRRQVCAEVELGALLPADVHVTLRRAASAEPGDEADEHPMFAEASLHNERYVFSTELPQETLAASPEWVVRVEAARPVPGAAALPPVEWRFTLGDAAADAHRVDGGALPRER